MYKKKISYCLNHKHVDNKILVNTQNYTWRMCNLCGLIYSDIKIKKHRNYLTKLKIFDNFKESNSIEFEKILKRVKFLDHNTNKKKWFDFGCGTGNELKIVKKHNLIGTGFEPNKRLFKKCKKKNLEVYNKLKDIKKTFNFIFTRNTFKYVENFPKSILSLSKLLEDNGLLIWRDKYFDYMPIKRYMRDVDETMVTSSFLKKNTIKFYLFHLNFEILFSKFYLDESFLIIAKKKGGLKRNDNYNLPKLSSFFNYSNFYIFTILRKILFYSYLKLRKVKSFFYEK